MMSDRTTSARNPASLSLRLRIAALVDASMTVIESRSTCRSYVLTIASTSTHLISLWRQGLNLSDQSHTETASLRACASMPTTNLGSSSTLRERSCILAPIVLSFQVLPRIGAGGCCKVANKYSGSFAPGRWFPPAPKQTLECGPRLAPQLDSSTLGASPMRHSKCLPGTCCPVSYSNTRQSFNPEYCRLVQRRAI